MIYDVEAIKQLRGGSPRHSYEHKFREPKLVIQRIRNQVLPRRLVAAHDGQHYYPLDTLNIMNFEGETSYTLYYILAVVNSTLLNWRYSLDNTSIIISNITLERLPIRRISFTIPHKERARLAEEGRGLTESRRDRLGADGTKETYALFLQSELGRWMSARLEAEPEQSDVIHDLLAYLAEQMTAMHKEKQAEAKGFLDWLAGYTGLPIEDWRLKTYVKAYWEHPWHEIRRALRQNRKAIEKASGRNVEGRQALEAIQSEFDQSVARLKPVLERIASTDRLIDLIVYRLYGLTEDEVAVVEESVGR